MTWPPPLATIAANATKAAATATGLTVNIFSDLQRVPLFGKKFRRGRSRRGVHQRSTPKSKEEKSRRTQRQQRQHHLTNELDEGRKNSKWTGVKSSSTSTLCTHTHTHTQHTHDQLQTKTAPMPIGLCALACVPRRPCRLPDDSSGYC